MIKKADKGPGVVIYDRNYAKEAKIQLSNQRVYNSVELEDKIFRELLGKSCHFFKYLKASDIT